MRVTIDKTEGYYPSIRIAADDTACRVETIDEWIRQLRIARAWLRGMPKAKKAGEIEARSISPLKPLEKKEKVA